MTISGMIFNALFVWLLVVTCTESIQVMFESFLQCNSTGVLECNLRVRKINRTTAALVGNFTYTKDVGSDYEVFLDVLCNGARIEIL